MKNDNESKSNNYNVYLIMGSLVVFLFILAPISLIYLTDINLVILILILGVFLLIGFLVMVLSSFNKDNDEDGKDNSKKAKFDVGVNENPNKVKSRNDFSKNVNEVKSRGNSNFGVSFSKSINDPFEDVDDEEDENLYSLNLSEEDFLGYRKL